ncbi:MAG: diaminopimelate epimerase [Firmicutes bacterium]|nr:diaminopimelate epimerase [Bacillota bacterium]
MLKFEKLHGLGNDFIIFDGINQNMPNYNELAKKVCNRHFGIGADGMMVAEKSDKADIKMCFYNADGTEAPMCGNGIRCFTKFVYDNNLIDKKSFNVETLAGIMKPEIKEIKGKISDVKVNLGTPNFIAKEIPVISEKEEFINEKIKVLGKEYNISAVAIGSIHSVIFSNNLDNIDIKEVGNLIENLEIFPKGINVNFSEIIDDRNIKVLTWERGVGQTLACGTGAAASAIIGSKICGLNKSLDVHLLGGVVNIEQNGKYVYMTGPAEFVCSGKYNF